MALFLGNLSPRVRCDELERAFQRFGRCDVQLKDGYGFVIYDVPVNAERALRALRGKVICGEKISLTWANKQPRPFQKFTRNRFSESHHGRNFMRDENNGIRSSSQDRRDFTTSKGKYLNSNSGEKGVRGDDTEEHGVEKGQNLKEGVMEEGDALEPNLLENDRWGEPVGNSTNNAVENGTEFDRYEPYHGFDRRDETEKQYITSSFDSGRASSPRRASREKSGFDYPRPKQICYVCGLMGHKMLNCPKADAPRRGFGHRQHRGVEFRGKSEGGIKKLRHTSWRGRSEGRGIMISRRHLNNRKESGSWKPRRLVRRTENFPEKKENRQSLRLRDSQGKKRGRKEHGSPNEHHRKKARTSESSLLQSDSTASSHSSSSSSKSVSGISSHSHSKSVSSRSHSVSSSSKSTSVSSYSQSRSSRFRSRSSCSRSLSLSISLGLQSPSPRKVQMDLTATSPKDDLEQVVALRSEHIFLEQRSPVGDVGVESSEHKDTSKLHKSEMNDMQPPGGALTAMKSSLQNFREMDSLQKSEPVQMDISISPSRTLEPQTPVNCQLSSSTRISSQEMSMVLKHYGLKAPEESELHLPVNAFFGAARLWPWEIIHYRRLKKGPISTENYARRIEQNKEFCIVDKYIRSSSGWGE